jgi:antitoxin HicB
MRYPVTTEQDTNGTVLVSFIDMPAHSVGGDEQAALLHAIAALETAVASYIERRMPVPTASPMQNGQHSVALPAQAAAKVLLHNEMINQGIRKAELARRLNIHMPQVDRLLNIRHASRIDALENAFRVLGKGLAFSLA